jgi:hypothetical protein
MEPRVVWVLGAGFSKALGGPLLGDLLRRDCLRTLGATFPRDEFPKLHGALPEAVVWLYHYGRGFPDGRRQTRVWEDAVGEVLWRDAEEFLDYVDSAAASPRGPARLNLTTILRQHKDDLFGNGTKLPHVAKLRGMARRLIAAECAAFLRSAELGLERWGPYRTWVTGLVGPRDWIVTFNYDVVPELLCTMHDRLQVVLPNQPVSSQERVHILKLHGSVSWQRVAPSMYEARAPDEVICCRCQHGDLAIATPGRTKAEQARDFGNLWALAESAIKDADAIVFLGYRFPPSDAEARGRILAALWNNRKKHLAVHTVLGPDVQSADSVRLRSLLRHSMGARQQYLPGRGQGMVFDLEQQPLYVEDFLSVVDREAILQPFMRR